MSKTLVIILGETRAHELTFDSFKKNVIDELNADLCLCIGVTPDYDYNNPFYKSAKYKFLHNELDDFGGDFDSAYNIISKDRPKYEKLENIICLNNDMQNSQNIKCYENHEKDNLDFNIIDDDEIVIYDNNFPHDFLKNKVFGKKISNINDYFGIHKNVTTYKKPLHWREFLKIKDHIFGGIKDNQNQHRGSAGMLIFFRWFLLQNLISNNLINEYDRFIITRSDYIYQLPHPKINCMNDTSIWIPDGEHYDGCTDRHAVLSKNNIEIYLNILNNLVLKSNDYFIKMKNKCDWNIERLIKFHLGQNNVLHLVKEFPYVMYSVRNINGKTSWSVGEYSHELCYYIKYPSEHDKSTYYKNEFKKSGLTIDEFYNKYIPTDTL